MPRPEKMRSIPVLKDILRVVWQWAGYLPPSLRCRNRMIDIKRGSRRVRSA